MTRSERRNELGAEGVCLCVVVCVCVCVHTCVQREKGYVDYTGQLQILSLRGET